MGNRLTPISVPGHLPPPLVRSGKAARWLAGLFPRLLTGLWSWLKRPLNLVGSREPAAVVAAAAAGRTGEQGPCQSRASLDRDHLEISFNLIRHLFDLCVVAFLCLASPVFRVALDVLGLRRLAGLWLHGMGLFLVTSYGMSLVLWLLQTYLAPLALAYGALQLLVLGVSLRPEQPHDEEPAEDGADSVPERSASEQAGL
ncbi:uncharacterized protein C6orf47 homolog [Mobula hypostoma]|uniref:uncharacterized protein C6orf47 homolog n=1 Tax=Mobula hypostoma TaxID=723540 RepID=UPI002FC2D091